MTWVQRGNVNGFPGFGTEEGTAAEGNDERITDSLIVVRHGDDPNVPAPLAAARYWIGSVEPLNAEDGDMWLEGLL
jgi:hypothetical protein